MKFTAEIKINCSDSLEETARVIGNILGVNFTLDEAQISYPNTYSYFAYNLGFCIELIGIEKIDYFDAIEDAKYTIQISEVLNHDSNQPSIDLSNRLIQVIESFENHQLKAYTQQP